MERYKISVIIPVYNVVRYLPKCIDSVRNQTYQNLEIIVIDDGSTDGCGGICDAYAKKDERIRVVHQKNQGRSAARNRALDIMTGDLVGFVDFDDWIEPDYYEVLEKHMRKTGADIVTSGYYYVYQDKVIKSRINHQEAPYDKYSGLKALSEHKIPHVVWNKLYRKNLFAALKFIEGRTYEDVLITYRLIMRAERIECMDIYGYHQTMRAGSIAHCPGGVVEDFSAHYELWQNVKAQKYLENIPEEIVDNFLKIRLCSLI